MLHSLLKACLQICLMCELLKGDIIMPQNNNITDEEEIIKRQDGCEELLNNSMDRDELREYLNPVYDLERLLARVSFGTANPRDLISLASSLRMLPHMITAV